MIDTWNTCLAGRIVRCLEYNTVRIIGSSPGFNLSWDSWHVICLQHLSFACRVRRYDWLRGPLSFSSFPSNQGPLIFHIKLCGSDRIVRGQIDDNLHNKVFHYLFLSLLHCVAQCFFLPGKSDMKGKLYKELKKMRLSGMASSLESQYQSGCIETISTDTILTEMIMAEDDLRHNKKLDWLFKKSGLTKTGAVFNESMPRPGSGLSKAKLNRIKKMEWVDIFIPTRQ